MDYVASKLNSEPFGSRPVEMTFRALSSSKFLTIVAAAVASLKVFRSAEDDSWKQRLSLLAIRLRNMD